MNSCINDISRPVIFLGSNSMLHKFSETCENLGIQVAGVIDSDYWGNTDTICDIPVIDSEECFVDTTRLKYYSNFNFFCATNWIPEKSAVAIRNFQKRLKLINLIQQYQLNTISIIDPGAQVSKYAVIGRGVFVDWNVQVNVGATVGDFTNIYCGTVIGHHSTIGTNCVFQRHSMLVNNATVGNNVYFGLCAKALKPGAKFGSGSIIQEAIYIRRGTVENEIVSMQSNNMQRIHQYPFIKE
jgi:serine acetyltransferase